jgi:hypothetical protein
VAPTVIDVELLLHGWDIAQGSGLTIEISDDVVDYVSSLAGQIIPKGRGDAFADEVSAAAGAGALDRLAAFSGRQQLSRA